MSSIMTNSAALTALQSLNATNKNLETTQSRISTGYRVATASDNAAYWSIATSMKSDNKALSAVQDSLGLGAGRVDTAYTAINDIKDQVDSIKAKLVTARGASLEDQQKIATEITAIQAQIKSSASNANYAGSNLLLNDAATTSDLNVAASYNRTGTTVSIDTIKVAAADTQIFGVVAATGAADYTAGSLKDIVATGATGLFNITSTSTTALTDTQIDASLKTVETALASLSTGAATLGAAKSRIDTQKSFLSNLSDSIDKGVGTLVDADMNKESTRLQALQVQQQLGIQALSIANGNSQSILSLFRG